MTDADIAALTRRLAGTAVDYKELYEAAQRDAEEAEAYAAELEKDRRKTYEALLLVSRLHSEVEAKLHKCVGALGDISNGEPEWPDDPQKELDWCRNRATTTLAELKGEDR